MYIGVAMWLDVKYLDLFVLQDGVKTTPHELKPAQLRKIVAQLGMDPTGDKDELHFSLIEHLKKKNAGSSSSGGDGESADSPGDAPGIVVAKQILEMQTDYPAVLSASGINITTDSSIATMRKAYLKLSLLIHPDKLQSIFPDATKAFQCLVNAYERLSQPELFLEDEDDEKVAKKKTVMRSNDGCHRTRLFCPRCNAEWGTMDSGVADYDYNFMMMGLKTYNCAGCLFDFGCMTAIHKCPMCRKGFEYHPSDFHRKIFCSNDKCKKTFGFFVFNISDRLEKEYRQEIRKKQEKQLKEKEQLQERERRAKSRQKGSMGATGKDKLFTLNLLDECPRCGEEVESSAELRETHLAECTDKKKIAAYAKKLKEEQDLAEKKSKAREAQEEAQNVSSWDYLGAKTADMWLLTEKQIKLMCQNYKIDDTGSKDELIARLVRHRNDLDSRRMITQGGEEGSSSGAPTKKKRKLNVEDLPTNMESLSVPQLKAFCASNGIVTKEGTKAGIIKQIEKIVHGDQPFLRLTGGKEKPVE